MIRMQALTLQLDLLVNLTSLLVLVKVVQVWENGTLSLGYKLNIQLLLETSLLNDCFVSKPRRSCHLSFG
jgi:hypothetical protein